MNLLLLLLRFLRVSAWVFSLKVSRAPISVECLFSSMECLFSTTLPHGDVAEEVHRVGQPAQAH
jgi:hypothetical protein